jgi:hypothetical protein
VKMKLTVYPTDHVPRILVNAKGKDNVGCMGDAAGNRKRERKGEVGEDGR